MHTTYSQVGVAAKFDELLKITNRSTPPNSKEGEHILRILNLKIF